MNRRQKISPNLRPASMPFLLMAVFALLIVMVIPVRAGGLLDSVITPTVPPTPTLRPLLPPIFSTKDSSNSGSNVGWLGMPADYTALASSRSLALLAGELIFHGLINASSCPDGGLMKSGAASPCGEVVAHNAVILWQNQFDEAIYTAAIQQGVPPYMLKNVIAQESQFWPGSHPTGYGYSEYGLGHMTTMGADTLLRWNRPFSSAFCLQVYSQEACRTSYALMPLDQQSVLRGAVIQRVNADCGSCPGGIDLRRARESVLFIAATLQASRSHAEWYVEGLTGRSFARLDPSDAWRFTLVGYNGGPGCLSSAISRSQGLHLQLSWKNISESLDKSCENANKYVENIKQVDIATPEELLAAQYDTSRAAEMVAESLGITFNPAGGNIEPTATPTGPAATATGTASSPTVTVAPGSETATSTPMTDPAITPTETSTPDPFITATETPTLDPSITATATIDPSVTATETPTLDPSITATATIDPSITVTATETPTLDPFITATPTSTTDPFFTPIPTFTLDPFFTPSLTPPTEPPATETPTETPVPTATPSMEPTPIVTPPAGPTVEIIVKFYSIVPDFIAEGIIASAGGRAEGNVSSSAVNVVSVPKNQVDAIVADLQGNLLVEYVEPNYTVQAFYTPNDPDFVNQTNLTDMQVPQAWDVSRGHGIVVAVIDTGMDFTHPELISNLWANPGEMGTDANGNDKSSNGIDDDADGFIDDVFGWNFIDNNNDFTDLNGHGTHSAGIIAASMNNSFGIAGVAPEARIMPLKVLDSTGHGTYAQVAQAIIYAVDHGAQVINLGFGGQADSQALRDATDYAYDHGVVVVAAAGNGGSDTLFYPAANPNVIAVEALDPALNLTSFSAYGYTYSVGAPGVGIYSTLPGGEFGHMSGTSMAAAEVSGVAALLLTQSQFDTVDKVRYAIFGSARDLGDYGHDLYFGYGLVQAYNALSYDPSTFSTPTPLPTPGGIITPTPTSSDTGVNIQGDAANASISNYTRACPIGAVFGALGGTAVPAVQADDGVSSAIPIGFDFWYMGTRYTNVYVSSNGWLSFTDPLGNSYPNNNAPTLSTGLPRPMIAPLWDDLSGVGGTASYSTTGAAPNRTFIFEWSNWRWSRTAAGAVISFRVYLYENTGVVRFGYVRNATAVTAASASVGMTGSSTGAGNFVAVNPATSFSAVCPTWSTASDPASIFAKPPSGEIFDFTPPVPANPTNLQIASTTSSSVTLTWTDNANNENGYVIYSSTDGVNFTTQAGAVAGWQSAEVAGTGLTGTTTVTGLSNIETMYWRVYAVSEGGLSAQPATITPPTLLNFTNIQPTSVTLNWTDSPDDAGYIVLNSTDGTDYTFVTQLPANTVTYNASGLTAGTSYAWRVQAINPRAISSAIQASIPAITITSPADASTFLQTDTITFTATATDAIEGNLAANVQWSSDLDGFLGTGGSLNKTGMSLGQHTITATVTSASGLTVTATITITITDAGGNSPPLLTITAPANNSAFAVGTNITFTGIASDIQDGNVSANIEWRSNINGNLGTGASVSTNSLTIGAHMITARVTDSGGLTSARTIRVFITNAGGALPPELTILSPANGATFTQGTTVGVLGNAAIRTNGDISDYIQWSSNLDGALVSNSSSFGITTLSVGTHIITATVTDANTGLTATATVTIVITALPGVAPSPHGNANGSTDACVICHDPHSASSWGPLLTFQDSPYENNNFCVSCHNTPAAAYSTHSNKDAIGALEQPFELLCVQCHDPHGNPPNLSNIRANVRLGTLPTTFDNMPQSSGPAILFTTRTGAGSFDDGSGASALCVACHQNASNPGAPMSLHNGGAGHNGGQNYTGQDCTTCHPHSTDSSQATNDGFTTTCRACHSQTQDLGQGSARRQIVGIPNGSGGNNNDFARASHHVAGNDTVTDADCKVCHEMTQHRQGKVRLFNQDAPGTVYTLDYLKTAADDPADYENFCLSCHDSNGRGGNTTPFSDKKLIPAMDTSLWAFAQHNIVRPLYSASCLDCHSNGHGSNRANMLSQFTITAPWDYQFTGSGSAPADVMNQEEDFCYQCHNATGTGTNIQPAFTSYTNTATRIFKHDVGATYTTHNPNEIFSSAFGGANRHIECDDCHAPHAARSGLSVAPFIQPELIGATGVEPVYGGGGAPVSYNFVNQPTAEYQICFKCHSSYTTLPGYSPDGWNGSAYVPNGLYKLITVTAPQVPDSRDMAREFNPNAASFHPVTAVGKNPNMPNSFVVGSGWTAGSRMFCSTCHTNGNPASGDNGPHGSPCLHLLRDAVNDATCNQYTTVNSFVRPNNNEICFTCHRSDVYNANLPTANSNLTYFRNGLGDNLHWKHVYDRRISCYTCHDSHGSEQWRLINFDTRAVDFEPGYDSQTAWSATFNPDGTTLTASCFVTGGGCHDTATYTP
jgi:thermitase